MLVISHDHTGDRSDMGRDGTLYEAWMTARAKAARGTGTAPTHRPMKVKATRVRTVSKTAANLSQRVSMFIKWFNERRPQITPSYKLTVGAACAAILIAIFVAARMSGPTASDASVAHPSATANVNVTPAMSVPAQKVSAASPSKPAAKSTDPWGAIFKERAR